MKLIICEKPSQVAPLKKVFGGEYRIANACGHVLEVRLGNKDWSLDILPLKFPRNQLNKNQIENYEIIPDKKMFYQKIKEELDKKPTEIICATDYDFEGQAIYSSIIEYYQKNGGKVTENQKRIVLKDFSTATIEKQKNKLEKIENYEGWKQRAYGRAFADILLGYNGTRAMTLAVGNEKNIISLGRVQTPTLKLVVDRYNENKNHIPVTTYGIDFGYNDISLKNEEHRFSSENECIQYMKKIGSNFNTKVSVNKATKKPPKLHSLSSLQILMNDKYKMGAKQVQKLVQSLYDQKYCTYPRTDCRYITEETAKDLKRNLMNNKETIVKYLNVDYQEEYNSQIVGETSAHEGLTITSEVPNISELNKNEKIIYDEILRTNVANFMPNLEIYTEEVSIQLEEFVYKESFKRNETKKNNISAWNEIYPYEGNFNLVGSYVDLNGLNLNYNMNIKKIISKPKKLFSEGLLIKAMESAGKTAKNENKQMFKEIKGIGTEATRADIIEGLYYRKYINLDKGKVIPTEKAIQLIALLEKINNPLVNIDFTVLLEQKLRELENNDNFNLFISQVDKIAEMIVNSAKSLDDVTIDNGIKILGKCPKCGTQVTGFKAKTGKYYVCETKECFIIGGKVKLTEADVEKLLVGKKTGQKTFRSKEGKTYKCKYSLQNGVLNRELVMTKARTRGKR